MIVKHTRPCAAKNGGQVTAAATDSVQEAAAGEAIKFSAHQELAQGLHQTLG